MTHVSVNQRNAVFLWQRSTPVIVGYWFVGCTWKNIVVGFTSWFMPAGWRPML